jgi:hypothetical protein
MCAFFVSIVSVFFKKTLTFSNLKGNEKANKISLITRIIGFSKWLFSGLKKIAEMTCLEVLISNLNQYLMNLSAIEEGIERFFFFPFMVTILAL